MGGSNFKDPLLYLDSASRLIERTVSCDMFLKGMFKELYVLAKRELGLFIVNYKMITQTHLV
jgi:hypothetical protein